MEEDLETYEGVKYTGYGISCLDSRVVVPDITTDKDKLMDFINLLNDEDLQVVHIFDVIEDFLDELR